MTFSGYEANTPATPGHVFDVVYDPASHSATWTNISSDIGDQPVNDAVLDAATGDLYISTDFGVYRRVAGETGDPGGRRPADGGRLRPDARLREERRPPASTPRRMAAAPTGSA